MDGATVIKVGIDAALSGGAATLLLMAPNAAVPTAVAIEVLKTSAHAVVDRLTRHQNQAVEILVEEAAKTTEIDMSALLEKIGSDDRCALAFAAALDAAWRTSIDEKTRALGRSVGKLTSDEALIDPESVWIDIFARVDRPHIRVLLALRAAEEERPAKPDMDYLGRRTGLGGVVWPLVETLVDINLITEETFGEGLVIGVRPRFSGNFKLGQLAEEFFERLALADSYVGINEST